MNRAHLKRVFKCSGVIVLPVIHVLDFEQTRHNIQISMDEGVRGCFLINNDLSSNPLQNFLGIGRTADSTL